MKLKEKLFKRPFRIEVTNVSTASYVNFTQMNSSISTNGALSMYMNILQDISDVYAKIEILIASSSGNYDLELVNKTIHVCEFFRNRRYEPIVQLFYKAMTKTGSFPHSCPIRKVKIASNFREKVFHSDLFRNCTSSKMFWSILKISLQYFRVRKVLVI